MCFIPNLALDHLEGEAPEAYSQAGHLQTAATVLYCLLLLLPEKTGRQLHARYLPSFIK